MANDHIQSTQKELQEHSHFKRVFVWYFVCLVFQYGVTSVFKTVCSRQTSWCWPVPTVCRLQPQSQQADLHLHERWHRHACVWASKGITGITNLKIHFCQEPLSRFDIVWSVPMFQECPVTVCHAGSPQNNCTMALSTTIIRFSPTPPVEPDAQANLDLPKSLDQVPPQHSKSLDPLPAHHRRIPEAARTGSALSCVRSQSECNFQRAEERHDDASPGCRNPQHLSDSSGRRLIKVDSGYSSNLNIQHASSSAAPQNSQQWEGPSSVSSSAYVGGLGIPPPFPAEGLHYVPVPSFKAAGLFDLPHQGDMQTLLSTRSYFNSQLAQQYLPPDAPVHPGAYHTGTLGNGLFAVSSTGTSFLFTLIIQGSFSILIYTLTAPFFPGMPSTNLAVKHIVAPSGPLGISGPHHIPRPHQSQQDVGLLGKPYPQYGVESLMSCESEEPRSQM